MMQGLAMNPLFNTANVRSIRHFVAHTVSVLDVRVPPCMVGGELRYLKHRM